MNDGFIKAKRDAKNWSHWEVFYVGPVFFTNISSVKLGRNSI